MTPEQIVRRRRFIRALSYGSGRAPPVMWPRVGGEDDGAARCFGDDHRASLVVGAVTPRDFSTERTTIRDSKRVSLAETTRLNQWLVTNLAAIPRVFMISDILPVVAAGVFDDASAMPRRQLMASRALMRNGFRLINKQSKGGCWCREKDYARVTTIKNGRLELLEVPDSLRPIRAATVIRQRQWKAKRERQRGVTGTMAASEESDALHAYESAGARVRQQRYRDRRAGKPIAPFRDGRRRPARPGSAAPGLA